jgi:hypothetical protein
MSKSMTSFDCSGINQLIMQKRARALIHIPPSRFNLVSPYPLFTQSQLDMRRKVEILKYNGNKQNTKTNNLTKKEKWALLSKGKSNSQTSQYTISNDLSYNTCASDLTKPTLTSSCDVPGSLIYLQYDPDVPLYNYNVIRTFGTEQQTEPLWNIYTNNILDFLVSNSNTANTDLPNILRSNTSKITSGSNIIILDNIENITVGLSVIKSGIPTGTTVVSLGNNNNIIRISNASTYDISINSTIRFINLNTQTMIRTYPLGSISITDKNLTNNHLFVMNVPLGIWVCGIYGNGIQDQSGNTIISSPETLTSTDTINITISSIYITVTYNDIEIPNTADISYANTQSLSILGSDVPNKETFYGIQYVGMVNISGLDLQTQPGNLYNLTMTVSYTYDTDISNKFDVFQTGIFPNIQEENQNIYSSNFKFNSDPYPVYYPGTFTHII